MNDANKLANSILKDIEKRKLAVKKLQDESPIVKAGKHWFDLSRFWFNISRTVIWIYQNIIYRFYSFVYKIFKTIYWKPYKYLWDNVTNTKTGFSKIRGALMLVFAVFYIVFLYETTAVVIDSVLYLTTANVNEEVYLSNSQEILGNENVHSVNGCLIQTINDVSSCDANNSLYFRIASSAFNHLWSLGHRGTLFYPDYIAAVVAPGWEPCTITSYGVRFKFLMRNWDIYPTLLDVKCITTN